jgi:hypothetical protein
MGNLSLFWSSSILFDSEFFYNKKMFVHNYFDTHLAVSTFLLLAIADLYCCCSSVLSSF